MCPACRIVTTSVSMQGVAFKNFNDKQVLGYEGVLGTLGVAALGFPVAWLLQGSDPGERPQASG